MMKPIHPWTEPGGWPNETTVRIGITGRIAGTISHGRILGRWYPSLANGEQLPPCTSEQDAINAIVYA